MKHDLQLRQLRLKLYPPVPVWEAVFMAFVAAFIGFGLAMGGF